MALNTRGPLFPLSAAVAVIVVAPATVAVGCLAGRPLPFLNAAIFTVAFGLVTLAVAGDFFFFDADDGLGGEGIRFETA